MYLKAFSLLLCVTSFFIFSSCKNSDDNVVPDTATCSILSNSSEEGKNSATFTYDSQNRLLTADFVYPPSVTFVRKRTHKLEYNAQNQVIRMIKTHIDSLGNVQYVNDYRFEYNNSGRIVSYYNAPDTARYHVTYDNKENITRISYPSYTNIYYRIEYDGNGNHIKSYSYLGSAEHLTQENLQTDDKKNPFYGWGIAGYLIGVQIFNIHNFTSYALYNNSGVKIGTYTCLMTYNEKGYPITMSYTYENADTGGLTHYATDTLQYNCH